MVNGMTMGIHSGRVIGYLCIFTTIGLSVYGNLILKWQVSKIETFPADPAGKIGALLRLLPNPWIISCAAAGFLAFLSWIIALSKFELSHAYPFTSLSFILVAVFSYLIFREPMTAGKIAGLALIVAGLIIGSRS